MSTRTCSSCTRTSENRHYDCPPRMADGRIFTDYRPRCDINYSALGDRLKTGISSYDYRQVLIASAEQIISDQRSVAYNNALCGPCMAPYDSGTMLPESSRMVCTAQTCAVKVGDPAGLGMGRDYGDQEYSASKGAFMQQKLAEQAAMAKSANCCGSGPQADTAYYGGGAPLPSSPSDPAWRLASPSGALAMSGGDAALVR